MSHRIKNLLAIEQALAQRTFKGTPPPPDALTTYSERLGAIGEAFMVLGREHKAVSLSDLVMATVAPFDDH
jgi:two-component sensor histidine kinase